MRKVYCDICGQEVLESKVAGQAGIPAGVFERGQPALNLKWLYWETTDMCSPCALKVSEVITKMKAEVKRG